MFINISTEKWTKHVILNGFSSRRPAGFTVTCENRETTKKELGKQLLNSVTFKGHAPF